MRRIILIVLSLIIFISCRGTITSPNKFDNNTSGGVTSPDDSDNTEDIPEIPQPPITEEELNKYGLEINTATAENIREALENIIKIMANIN